MKDRKVEQFKHKHFKHLLFWGISLETQRPYMKDWLCAATTVSSEAGCAFSPHRPSHTAQVSTAETKGWYKLRRQLLAKPTQLSHRSPQSHLPSVPSHGLRSLAPALAPAPRLRRARPGERSKDVRFALDKISFIFVGMYY